MPTQTEDFVRTEDLVRTEYFVRMSISVTSFKMYKHAQIQKVLSEGSNFDNYFFSLMRGGRIQIPLLAGHQRPASETPFKWRFASGSRMVQH